MHGMVHLQCDIFLVNFMCKTVVVLTFQSRLYRTASGTILPFLMRCDVLLVTSLVNREVAVACVQDLQPGLCLTGQMFFSQHHFPLPASSLSSPSSRLSFITKTLHWYFIILPLVHFLLHLSPSPPFLSLFHHPHLSNSHFNPSIPLRSATSSPEGPVKQTVTHSGDLDNK